MKTLKRILKQDKERFNVPKGFDINSGKLVLANYDNVSLVLKPYETRVYIWEK